VELLVPGCSVSTSISFLKKDGYATAFGDLRGHKIFDLVLGRSEAALEAYLAKLPGKERVRIVCMDLASVYRAMVRKLFPKAKIVADRFHVIRLINHHFLACWREINPAGSKQGGLLSLMRRHRHHLEPEQRTKLEAYFKQFPVLRKIYRFRQRLCYLLLNKHRRAGTAVIWRSAFLRRWSSCASPHWCNWCSLAIPSLPGARRLPACGASPGVTHH
jgi:transposase